MVASPKRREKPVLFSFGVLRPESWITSILRNK